MNLFLQHFLSQPLLFVLFCIETESYCLLSTWRQQRCAPRPTTQSLTLCSTNSTRKYTCLGSTRLWYDIKWTSRLTCHVNIVFKYWSFYAGQSMFPNHEWHHITGLSLSWLIKYYLLIQNNYSNSTSSLCYCSLSGLYTRFHVPLSLIFCFSHNQHQSNLWVLCVGVSGHR